MAIYTRKGDKGRTGLFVVKPAPKKRIAKDSVRIEAVGTIDELNSLMGVCISLFEDLSKKRLDVSIHRVNNSHSKLQEEGNKLSVKSELLDIQKNLLTIGSIVGNSPLVFNGAEEAKKLERLIDTIDLEIPKLTNFILPGGSTPAAMLHLARSVSRRAERLFVTFSRGKSDKRYIEIKVYLNRLSDALFTLARYVNYKMKVTEDVWKPVKS